MTNWDELQPELRRVFLQRGSTPAREVAKQIPVSRATLYRLVGQDGSNRKPPHAVQQGVQRYVDNKDQEQ